MQLGITTLLSKGRGRQRVHRNHSSFNRMSTIRQSFRTMAEGARAAAKTGGEPACMHSVVLQLVPPLLNSGGGQKRAIAVLPSCCVCMGRRLRVGAQTAVSNTPLKCEKLNPDTSIHILHHVGQTPYLRTRTYRTHPPSTILRRCERGYPPGDAHGLAQQHGPRWGHRQPCKRVLTLLGRQSHRL